MDFKDFHYYMFFKAPTYSYRCPKCDNTDSFEFEQKFVLERSLRKIDDFKYDSEAIIKITCKDCHYSGNFEEFEENEINNE